MNEALLQVPAELVKAEMRALTKDAKLTFTTNEGVAPEVLTKIIGNTGRTGWLTFLVSERPIDVLDVATLPEITAEKGEKTKGQRLRACLFRLWEHEKAQGLTTATSEEFYNVKMEQLIDFVKEKLPRE